MERRLLGAAGLLGVTLGLGIAVAGWFLGSALFRARAADRFVTVKGLSEREVAADVALWPIVFVVTANDLGTLQGELEESAATVASFLDEQGFGRDEWSRSAPRVTDFAAQGYGGNQPPQRYQAEATVTLRTGKIDDLQRAMARSGDLVKRGVALIRSYEYNTQYVYTGLEAIKPEMIAAATKDARRAAEQFAQDSGSRVGAIRRAQQGYFSVEDRDAFSPEIKTVRVVTTIEYFLDD